MNRTIQQLEAQVSTLKFQLRQQVMNVTGLENRLKDQERTHKAELVGSLEQRSQLLQTMGGHCLAMVRSAEAARARALARLAKARRPWYTRLAIRLWGCLRCVSQPLTSHL